MAFFTKLVRALTYPKYMAFERACRDPEAAQAKLWKETKTLMAGGTFWRGKIKETLSDYPVTDYEFYREALDGSFAATVSPLTGEKILFWSESGGTTGKAKIYPLTESFQKSFQSTTPPFLHSLACRFPGFLAKPVLYFASTLPSERSLAGVEKGFISGFNYRNIPSLLQRKYAFPINVFRSREVFFRWGPLYALVTDLSAMIAITPSMLEQFARAVEENIPSYWPYLEGKIKEAPAPDLPPLRCSKKRLALLKQAFSRPGHFSFREVWPGLEFVCCWKTATCGMQLVRLDPWLKNEVPVIDATYSATEGWITVPLFNEKPGGPLHPGALILEFFPAGEEPSGANILPPWRLEPGKFYEVLLTTKMGFVRFRLYDVVKCTGYFHKSPILEFAEKAGNAVSLGHTRVSETHVLNALELSEVELHGPWILAPAKDASGLLFHYRDENRELEFTLKKLDDALQQANVEYYEDIRDRLLVPIRAARLPENHELWTKASHAQTKPKVIQQKAV